MLKAWEKSEKKIVYWSLTSQFFVLTFCQASSNSVSIPVYSVAQLYYLPIHLIIFLFLVICFKLSTTQPFFFYFPRRFELSGVNYSPTF